MLKRYRVDYDWKWEMVVEIDHSIMTDEKLHEINNFWTDSDYRLQRANGNILHAVLKMLARRAFMLTVERFDPIDAFNWKQGCGIEGWPSMDGSAGIKIVSIDDLELDDDDINVKELA